MARMGELAAQDIYDANEAYRPLGNDPWTNTMLGTPVAPGQGFPAPLPPSPVLYHTKAGDITEADIGNTIDVGMGVSGGGLKTEAVGMGKVLAPLKDPGNSIFRQATISRAPPPWQELPPEEFKVPTTAVPPELANAYRDPRLRAKAENIWNTYPQYGEAYPEVGPPALKEKAPDPKNPGKFLIAPKKGEIPYGSMDEALAKAEEPNYFLEKKLTPEAELFQKQRNIVQKDMDLHGYPRYFDPAQRADIPASDYGPFADTAVAASPKKAPVDAAWTEKYGTPEARQRLQEGYEKGQSLGNAENWYFMKQLQDKYVETLGETAGKEAFKKEFSGMMAATTGGASPYNNWLMSHYAGYLNKQGLRVDQRAYEMPFPIGGRFASGNMEQAQKYIDSGMKGFDPAKNPKRYDFDNALAGDKNAGVIDEQMSGAFVPGMTIPEWYGPATRILREEAAKAGTDPRAFQDVGWAGLKAIKTEEAAAAAAAKRANGRPGIGHNSEPFQFQYEGPMIDQINRSIETTHRLTGMPIEEIVTRGVIKKEIPMYGLGAVGLTGVMGGLARQDNYQPEERM